MKRQDQESPDLDSQLMLAVKAGNRQAFSTLFRRNSKSLFHFVCRFVKNHSVAEELVQEIFVKVYKAAGNYEPRSKFKTYLFRIATNHCLNEVRRAHNKEKFDSIDESRETEYRGKPIELVDERNPSPDSVLEGQAVAEKLQDYLMELPEKQRIALLLNRLEGMSYQDIADTMNMSVGAIKSLLHRARHTLQERLEKWNENIKTI